MKRFTKLFSLLLVVSFLVGIIPAGAVRADEEKKYRVELTGEYDLSNYSKVVYNYDKMMKKMKLEKVKGKNEWNLTMYEDTVVFLPFTTTYSSDIVKDDSGSDIDVYDHGSAYPCKYLWISDAYKE